MYCRQSHMGLEIYVLISYYGGLKYTPLIFQKNTKKEVFIMNAFVQGMSYAEVAKKLTKVSDLVIGRTKISSEDLMVKYPDGFTVTRFDITTFDDKPQAIVTIKEDDTVFYNCPSALTKMFTGMVSMIGTSVADISNDIFESGGIKIKLEKTFSKNGKTYLKPIIVE